MSKTIKELHAARAAKHASNKPGAKATPQKTAIKLDAKPETSTGSIAVEQLAGTIAGSVTLLDDNGQPVQSLEGITKDGESVTVTAEDVKLSLDMETIAPPVVPVTAPAFTIRTGKPIPATNRKERAMKYPFSALEINQSFFVPGAKVSSMSSVASAAGKKLSKGGARFFFVARADEEDGLKGVSVWRVEPKAESPALPAPVGMEEATA